MIVARVFFVWVSVFNLFAVAVFWSFMADLFTSEQGKRLFGFIGAGGTAGALLGPVITIGAVGAARPRQPAARGHRVARAGGVLRPSPRARGDARDRTQRPGSDSASAAAPSRRCPSSSARPICSASARGSACCRSARRSSISQQANIVAATVHGAGAQTRIFAGIDLAVGLLTLATQVFATGRLLKRFGTGVAAGALPAVYVVGFAALALAPSLIVVVISGGRSAG